MSRKTEMYRSPSDQAVIELDPNNDGSLVRKAFLLEGFLNLFSLPLVTHPRETLSYLLLNPNHINPSTIFWARSLGSLVVSALTIALWTGVPNTKAAIESRRTVYITLGMGELALMPILLMEASKNNGPDAALSVKASYLSIASLAPLLLWRVYVLYVKPTMIGRYRDVKRE